MITILVNLMADSLQFDSSNGETDRQRIKTAMLLSISYSASIGGAGTLIGSGAPLAFKGILEQ